MKRLVFLLGFIFLINFVLATSPLAPSPNCEVVGKINSQTDFCPDKSSPCAMILVMQYNHLNVSIKSVSYINGSLEYSNCDELFPIGFEKTFSTYAYFNESDIGKNIRIITSNSDYIQSYSILIGNYCDKDSNCPNPRPEGVCGGCYGKCGDNQCLTLCADCPKPNIFQRIINWFKNLF